MSAASAPTSITIGILTYRRPGTLTVALPQVLEQAREHAHASGDDVRVVVVDNDPEGSAEETVAAFGDPLLSYVVEPAPGIAHARNRALAESDGRRLLVFIDDDEAPEPEWLAHLIATWRETGAAAVMGRVVSTFEVPLDPWIAAGRFFQRRRLPTGTEISVAASGNLLLDLEQVRALGVRFDPRLGLGGGEDTLFSRQLVARGGRIVWCDESVAIDMVPADRATRQWVLRRAWSHGNTSARVDLWMASTALLRGGARLHAATGGALRVCGGTARFALGLAVDDLTHQARGLRAMYRGAGMAAAAFGVHYQEYARFSQTGAAKSAADQLSREPAGTPSR